MALPKYIKPSTSIESAARMAHMRNRFLKVYWDQMMGLRIVEVQREKPDKK